MYREGVPTADILTETSMSRSSFYYILSKAGIHPDRQAAFTPSPAREAVMLRAELVRVREELEQAQADRARQGRIIDFLLRHSDGVPADAEAEELSNG